MYHIRRADTKEERSIYAQTEDGLVFAKAEALMRAGQHMVAHEVCDDNGIVIVTIPGLNPERAAIIADAVDSTRAEMAGAPMVLSENDRFLTVIISCLVAAIVLRVLFG